MGLILYCGIRHERNVEKARDYLDGDTIEFLERALKHPDLVKPYGRILYGDSSRYLERYGREVYLVGCLKAGGLLKDVPLDRVQDFETALINNLLGSETLATLKKGIINDEVTAKIEEVAAAVASALKKS